ncbi:MAG: hypothetical protein P8Y66_10210 [Nitrospirota bacterium]|jgi:hypothetical protein
MEKAERAYEEALRKRAELGAELRALEHTAPESFKELWMLRDRLAYWEGKADGLKLALEELKGRKRP